MENTNDELLRLTIENNKILRGLRRHQRLSTFFTFIYWIIIIGSLAGAYYYIRPAVQSFTGNNEKVQHTFDQFEALQRQFSGSPFFENLYKQYMNTNQEATSSDQI